jgi:light-regulated signal transduction histidine kinase (bacteriophytochrome)
MEGFTVITAADGQEGVERTRADRPDIVVSDVMMPHLDGFGLVRELRKERSTASLPVLLLSARAGEEAAVAGLDSGSDDYLAKPFSARELLARVRTHVELARLRKAWSAELERANKELEAFSYSVSHDLRAPLRQIRGFAQILAKDYAAAIDARGHGHLQYIVSGVEKMSALIDGLLEMGRVSRSPLNLAAVDLSALAREIVADLKKTDAARNVHVEIADGLTARGDRRLMSVVLVNLIGNAWKFSAKAADARIELGLADGAPSTFYVRDNGAGFDMAYAGKLFGPFQRLHHADEFEGTGIGLATVQRIVRRHGGDIWAEGEVGAGATVSFTLPPENEEP